MMTFEEKRNAVRYYENLSDKHNEWSRDYTMLASSRKYHENKAKLYAQTAEDIRKM